LRANELLRFLFDELIGQGEPEAGRQELEKTRKRVGRSGLFGWSIKEAVFSV
jgi:hypothetical protein